MNTFGNIFRLTTFGESHGAALGGVIDGMPAGLKIDLDLVQAELDRRRPGQSSLVTQRNEPDRVEVLSGLFDGVTTGTPIGFVIANTNQHSRDYEEMRHCWRPSHADMTYSVKYGLRDYRGGGRASARETAARVAAGAFARQALAAKGISVSAYTQQIGPIAVALPYTALDFGKVYDNPVRCPDAQTAELMAQFIERVKSAGDTVGGIVKCVIKGCPAGLGDPLFDKLQARLAAAMLSIPAVKGFDYGLGFDNCCCLGSEMIDEFTVDKEGAVTTRSNHSGGIQGGISNGSDIYFRVAFKPVATLLRQVSTVTDTGEPTTLKARGRHDACVLPRAVPVVEAMAAMTLLDALLSNRTVRIDRL